MLEAIAKRCSVRGYTDEPVSEDDLQQVLEAALSAPTANNVRPWHIVVVTDADKRQRLSTMSQWASFCAESPVVLAFCGFVRRSGKRAHSGGGAGSGRLLDRGARGRGRERSGSRAAGPCARGAGGARGHQRAGDREPRTPVWRDGQQACRTDGCDTSRELVK